MNPIHPIHPSSKTLYPNKFKTFRVWFYLTRIHGMDRIVEDAQGVEDAKGVEDALR
jgi:hypothetical protein